jgi:O-methyltransferase
MKKIFISLKPKLFHLIFLPLYFIFALLFKKQIIMTVCPFKDKKYKDISLYYDTGDFVRARTLSFVAEMIYERNICGHVAEAGVYRGDFARRISQVFNDRKIFLYDTFEGFDASETEREVNNLYTNRKTLNKYNNFKNTNIDIVLDKMYNKDLCVIRKGIFPNSAENDKDNKFAFVSIDLDLSESILAALRFFYPRLTTGGYIFLHDYNHSDFSGVQEAVKLFEQENGSICKVPLADCFGTIVLTK